MKKIICSTLLVLLILSCQKEQVDQVTLPPVTSSGKNTIGFLVNDSTVWSGEEVVPAATYGNFNYKPDIQFTVQTNADSSKTFFVKARMLVKDKSGTITNNSEISIQMDNVNLLPNTYFFDGTSATRSVIFKNKLPVSTYANKGNTFMFTIGYIDTSKHIIAGTFSGTLYAYNNGFNLSDSLLVNQGRFDAVYSQ